MHELETNDTKLTYSGFGIASLMIGLLTLAGACLVFALVLAGIGTGLSLALGLCGGGILAFVGIGLGIAGAVRGRSKVVPILGVILNAVFVSLATVLLLVVFLQANSMAPLT